MDRRWGASLVRGVRRATAASREEGEMPVYAYHTGPASWSRHDEVPAGSFRPERMFAALRVRRAGGPAPTFDACRDAGEACWVARLFVGLGGAAAPRRRVHAVLALAERGLGSEQPPFPALHHGLGPLTWYRGDESSTETALQVVVFKPLGVPPSTFQARVAALAESLARHRGGPVVAEFQSNGVAHSMAAAW